MGHSGDTIEMAGHAGHVATIQRNPTMPLSKRESLISNGSRLSLLATGSGATNHISSPPTGNGAVGNQRHWGEKDFVNTNTEMVTGKKRTTKKVKRTDSYKQALNRESASDLINDGPEIVSETRHRITDGTVHEDRKKYNTLPIKPGNSQPLLVPSVVKQKLVIGRSRTKNEFERSASQKSGTYPSPDTDDEQRSTRLDKKKKSKFTRMKERLIHTFKKDKDKKKPSTGKGHAAPSHKVKPHHSDHSTKAFSTPSGGIEEVEDITYRNSSSEKSPGLLKRFRNSFRGSKKLFETLIDPSRPRPDKSKLKLDLRHTFKPACRQRYTGHNAGDRARHAGDRAGHGGWNAPLTPDEVECDGLDFADGHASGVSVPPPQEEEFITELMEDAERLRAVGEVASRLGAIGDSMLVRRESESSGEELQGHLVVPHPGLRRRSSFEESLIQDLRHFADNSDLFSQPDSRPRLTPGIVPVIKALVLAQDYSCFRQIISREISSNIGWEQVAWYTYLVRTSMLVADAGRSLGSNVHGFATQYFRSTIQPWIRNRPNGWESIHEETDISESEVD
ncbi:hypothetical protein MAR_017092 [Mya arenaria]|uniref:Uncharacterized protein n=1 Tax=Mya arenaria TaxID=6604 RepID=A0ABY7EDF5_MYAAR|nr:hypothetical protein MAR_017092 [Mya arenaria]